jgi:hypothetical protein
LSTLSSTNNYPALIEIHDTMFPLCVGFTNMHNWQFSADGGTTRIQFENCSAYHFCADVTVTGVGNGEAGLNLNPWWFPEAGGKFMLNVGTGEIACFDGRLPFYSFTVNHGITYVRGTTVKMEITYLPHGLSMVDPATVEYKITIGSNTYTSGPLAFDQGNASEDPPHGLWGALVPNYAGGYFQPNVTAVGDPPQATGDLDVKFENICFDNLQVTPVRAGLMGPSQGALSLIVQNTSPLRPLSTAGVVAFVLAAEEAARNRPGKEEPQHGTDPAPQSLLVGRAPRAPRGSGSRPARGERRHDRNPHVQRLSDLHPQHQQQLPGFDRDHRRDGPAVRGLRQPAQLELLRGRRRDRRRVQRQLELPFRRRRGDLGRRSGRGRPAHLALVRKVRGRAHDGERHDRRDRVLRRGTPLLQLHREPRHHTTRAATTIHMEATYRANDLSSANPATIQYHIVYNGTPYDSPILPFGEQNPNECDPQRAVGHAERRARRLLLPAARGIPAHRSPRAGPTSSTNNCPRARGRRRRTRRSSRCAPSTTVRSRPYRAPTITRRRSRSPT